MADLRKVARNAGGEGRQWESNRGMRTGILEFAAVNVLSRSDGMPKRDNYDRTKASLRYQRWVQIKLEKVKAAQLTVWSAGFLTLV